MLEEDYIYWKFQVFEVFWHETFLATLSRTSTGQITSVWVDWRGYSDTHADIPESREVFVHMERH